MTRISCGENCPSVELNLEKMITNAKEIKIKSHKECNISCETHTVLTFFLAIRFGPLLRSAPNLQIYLLRLELNLMLFGKVYQHEVLSFF